MLEFLSHRFQCHRIHLNQLRARLKIIITILDNFLIDKMSSCNIMMTLLYITSQVSDRISLAAAHLLVSITTTVRPNFFFAIEQGQKLFQTVEGKIQECNETVSMFFFSLFFTFMIQ